MFEGFTKKTSDFLWELAFNNERAWFLEHKEEFEQVLNTPFRLLAKETYELFTLRHPELDCKLHIARIYRDARRLHGRGPYKDNLWLSIERPAELWTANTCFWFGVHPEYWSYGMGYWMPKPATMAALRRRIDADPKTMECMMKGLAAQSEFTLETEEYKKLRSVPPSPILEPWYRAKNFSLGHQEPWTEELYSRAVVERMKQGFEFLLPWYDYFVTLEGEEVPAAPRE